jgi:hypothetical protein
MFIKHTVCISFVVDIILLFLFSSTFYGAVYSQSPSELTSQSTPTEWVKIANPITGQKIVAGQELEVGGESSDSTSTDCDVSVIVNNIRPYQKASAAGPSGDNDFSKWSYAIHENYTILNEGENKITAKLSCLTPLVTRWYSAIVTGESTSQTVNTNKRTTTSSHSEFNSTGSIEALHTLRSEESSKNTAISGIPPLPGDNGQSLRVSIIAQKNPVSRGDNQSITLTVTDSNSKKIPGAQIDGVLKYPGGNYEKDFEGITDLDGNFLYPWMIGKNGDLGSL